MKLNNKIVTLMAITSIKVLAELENPLGKIKDLDITEYEDCLKNIKNYFNECVALEKDSYSSIKIESFCEKFSSEKCQSFYKDPIKIMDGCDKLPDSIKEKIKDNYLKESFESSDIMCAKDENGNYCPIAKLNLFSGSTLEDFKLVNDQFPSKDDLEKAINDTCLSKKCSENAYRNLKLTASKVAKITDTDNHHKSKRDTAVIIDFAYQLIKTLDSEECKAKQNQEAQNPLSKSDANVIKLDTALLVVLSILLVLFINSN